MPRRTNPTQEQTISEIIDKYKRDKDMENHLKKLNTQNGTKIKDYFDKHGISSFDTDTCTATVSTSKSESLNDDLAIEIIKEHLGGALLASVVKQKEYIDEDALEKLVYNGDFDISLLEKAKIVKVTKTLRISKRNIEEGRREKC